MCIRDSGKILLAGGVLFQPPDATTTELFDPATSTFTTTAPLIVDHSSGTSSTLLPSGRVLIVGGPLAEVYASQGSGLACTKNEECESGFCVDGVCCNSACANQCEACDRTGSVGKCGPTTGAPRGARRGCPGAGVCGGACNGMLTTACVYPTNDCGTSCTEARESKKTCDGKGRCVSETPGPCPGNFACETAAGCRTRCSNSEDCAAGYGCAPDGRCVAAGACADDRTSQPIGGGAAISCVPYRCDTTGSCRTTCASIEDCVTPAVCDPSGRCVAGAEEEDGGCATAPRPREGERAFLLLAAVFVVMAARRRVKSKGAVQ